MFIFERSTRVKATPQLVRKHVHHRRSVVRRYKLRVADVCTSQRRCWCHSIKKVANEAQQIMCQVHSLGVCREGNTTNITRRRVTILRCSKGRHQLHGSRPDYCSPSSYVTLNSCLNSSSISLSTPISSRTSVHITHARLRAINT